MKLATVMILSALSMGIAQASGPVGVYTLIDKVVLEPSAENPERILIYGAFSIRTDNQGTFQAPQRGYLYYALPPGANKAAILREWSDLKGAAGTRTVIAFGGTSFGEYAADGRGVTRAPVYQPPRLRKTGHKPENPDLYVTGSGLSKVRSDTDYGPVKSLLYLK